MPYGISQNQSDCAGWATVKRNPDGSLDTIGCHVSKQDAIDQMVAASLDEDMEPLGEVRAEGYSPTAGMKDEAQKGLDWRAEFGRGGTMVGVSRARDIVNGRNLSLDTVKRMRSYFARHEVDKQGQGWSPGEDGFPSAGRIAWALWGGDPGRTWADNILDSMDEREIVIDLGEGADGEPLEPGTVEVEMPEEESGAESEELEVGVSVEAHITIPTGWVVAQQGSRSIAYTNREVRAVPSGNRLVGYAAIFDSPSEPLPWTEYVQRGAFQKTIKDGADVRLLIDHEGVPLARSKSGTLTIEEDDIGLRVEADLDPNNPDAARIMSALKRGDLSQMSFAFRTIKDSWSADKMTRKLHEVQLYDVSVVTFPAYEETVAELRSSKTNVIVSPSSNIRLRKAQIAIERHRSR